MRNIVIEVNSSVDKFVCIVALVLLLELLLLQELLMLLRSVSLLNLSLNKLIKSRVDIGYVISYSQLASALFLYLDVLLLDLPHWHSITEL